MQGTLRVRRGPADEWKSCGAALVRPDAFHEVDARDGTVLIGFVDAESELGACSGYACSGRRCSLSSRWPRKPSSANATGLAGSRLERIGCDVPYGARGAPGLLAVTLSSSVGETARSFGAAGCSTMNVFGSIPWVVHVRATITAGCSPKFSAIAEVASDAKPRAAASPRSVLTFIAALLVVD
jgi:hypothetical protein